MGHVFASVVASRHACARPRRTSRIRGSQLALDMEVPRPRPPPNHLPLAQISIPGNAGQGLAVSPASRPGTPYR
jgi:hypothetical protein